MSRFWIFLAVIIDLSSTAGSAQCAEISYTGAASRDPFSAPFEQKSSPAESQEIDEKKLRALIVQGIVASTASPRAIINGKIYRVGNDLLPGVKVSRIEKEGVFVTYGEKETLLNRSIQPIKGKTAR